MSRADNSAPFAVGEPPQAPPPELRDALLPGVPAIVEAAIAEIRSRGGMRAYSQEALERNLRLGLTDAVDRWFEPARPSAAPDLHFALGRAQARAGRSLDELMGFYRIAGQAMWRRVAELGAQLGARPEDLYRLAETGFGCVDELSTHAAAGFSEEQSHRSGASQSRRSEFVRLLLREPQPPAGRARGRRRDRRRRSSRRRVALFVGPGEMYEAFARSALDQAVLGPREAEFVGVAVRPRRARAPRAPAARPPNARARGSRWAPPFRSRAARESLARARALLDADGRRARRDAAAWPARRSTSSSCCSAPTRSSRASSPSAGSRRWRRCRARRRARTSR